jgi:hypothetical protein
MFSDLLLCPLAEKMRCARRTHGVLSSIVAVAALSVHFAVSHATVPTKLAIDNTQTPSASETQGKLTVNAPDAGTLFIDHTTPSTVEHRLRNPGFEEDPIPMESCPRANWGGARVSGAIANGWRDNTCWADSSNAVTYSIEVVDGHGGSIAQKMVVTGQGVLFQQVSFLNRLYVGRIWLRAENPMTVRILLRQQSQPYKSYGSSSVVVQSTWTEYTFSGLPPATQGLFMIVAETSGTLWVDDASLDVVVPKLPAGAVPAEYFGMHIHRTNIPNPWKLNADDSRNPINAVRLWDASGGAWRNACPTQRCGASHEDPAWSWGALDAHVTRARNNGADLLFTLGGVTPTWASARPKECSPWNKVTGGHGAEPSNDQDWRDWVSAVGTRYEGKIKYWQIWNEPQFESKPNIPPDNCANFFTGTPERLLSLAQQARDILKQIDPANVIIGPSAGAVRDAESFLKIGGSKSVDIISYHFYTCDPEASYKRDIPLVRSLMNTYGAGNKPLWDSGQFGALFSIKVGRRRRSVLLLCLG